jgi:isopenicillin-N epimerase
MASGRNSGLLSLPRVTTPNPPTIELADAANLRTPAADPRRWPLDPAVTFLNHGSFGSCPLSVLEFQREVRARLERQPIQFFVRDLEGLWDEARHALAQFVGADTDELVFVPNATTGINAVLRSLDFEAGDELLVTDQEYNACRNALNYVAERSGARTVVAPIPFPLRNEDEMIAPILERVTSRTCLALVDHVTSQTSLVFPLRRLVQELAARGVDALVDGAHAPGMVPLNLREIGAAYYTGNCHKWICAPKGAAFLTVRANRQKLIRPLVISHGANSSRTDRSRFLIEFGWMGTADPSAMLAVPEALRFMAAQLPGGWPTIMERNRKLALAARGVLCAALKIEPPAPDEFIGSLASVPIRDAANVEPSKSPLYLDPLQDRLLHDHSIEVPVIPWPQPPKRLLRISAQLYNSIPQYERLASALLDLR